MLDNKVMNFVWFVCVVVWVQVLLKFNVLWLGDAIKFIVNGLLSFVDGKVIGELLGKIFIFMF